MGGIVILYRSPQQDTNLHPSSPENEGELNVGLSMRQEYLHGVQQILCPPLTVESNPTHQPTDDEERRPRSHSPWCRIALYRRDVFPQLHFYILDNCSSDEYSSGE